LDQSEVTAAQTQGAPNSGPGGLQRDETLTGTKTRRESDRRRGIKREIMKRRKKKDRS
jgi:hypothetical protein